MTLPDPEVVLFSFSDLTLDGGKVLKAATIASTLLEKKLWYVGKRSAALAIGRNALFFMGGGVGVVAAATIAKLDILPTQNHVSIGGFSFPFFSVRVILENIEMFEKPVPIRPLVQRLSFITNKKYWGTSFQFSVRTIPFPDAKLIRSFAREIGCHDVGTKDR